MSRKRVRKGKVQHDLWSWAEERELPRDGLHSGISGVIPLSAQLPVAGWNDDRHQATEVLQKLLAVNGAALVDRPYGEDFLPRLRKYLCDGCKHFKESNSQRANAAGQSVKNDVAVALQKASEERLPTFDALRLHKPGLCHVAAQSWCPILSSYQSVSSVDHTSNAAESGDRWEKRHVGIRSGPAVAAPKVRETICAVEGRCLCSGRGRKLRVLVQRLLRHIQDCYPVGHRGPLQEGKRGRLLLM